MSILLPELARKGESHRLKRVSEQVRDFLSEAIIRGDLPSFISFSLSPTINSVELSPDLRHAKVFFSTFDNNSHDVGKKLNLASKHLRHVLGKKMTTKYTPKLVFYHDEQMAVTNRVEELLSKFSQ